MTVSYGPVTFDNDPHGPSTARPSIAVPSVNRQPTIGVHLGAP
jgi:hypothetical protein